MKIIKTAIVIILLILLCIIGNDLLSDGMISHEISAEDITDNQNEYAVNINNADFDELLSIKYIGNKMAENIIGYRETYGDFTDIEQIKNIEGISDKTFEEIKSKIRVGE